MNKKQLKRIIAKGALYTGSRVSKRLQGSTLLHSKKWGKNVANDFPRQRGLSLQKKLDAYSHSFLSDSYNRYDLKHNSYEDYITDYEFGFVQPVNNYFNFWLKNRLIQRYIMQHYSGFFTPLYYTISKSSDSNVIFCIKDGTKLSAEVFFSAVKENKTPLLLMPAHGNKNPFYSVRFTGESITVNDDPLDIEDYDDFINDLPATYMVVGDIASAPELKSATGENDSVYRFITITDENNETSIVGCDLVSAPHTACKNRIMDIKCSINLDTGAISLPSPIHHNDYCSIPWSDVCAKVKEIANYISEAEFVSVFIRPTKNIIYLDQISPVTALPSTAKKGSVLYKYIKDLYDYKQTAYKTGELQRSSPLKQKALNQYTKRFLRKGIRPYMAGIWLNTVKDDFLHTDKPLKTKLWAWKRGFPSYRIEQYGLTEDNYKYILSDFDYAWLNRINNHYRLLVDDKLSLRYTLDSFKSYLPEYYYLISKRRDKRHLKPLPDLSESYPNTKAGILSLLRDKEKLAFKPVNGTHGDGFYKLEYDGSYIVNGDKVSEAELLDILYNQKSIYCITEFVEMHPALKEIYPVSVNTIRVLVINRNYTDPTIEHAYMRIGSSKTGFTDNIGYGGICCYMDAETGHYYRGQKIINHKFIDCDVHPDTGVALEGYVPHWESARKGILDICKFIPWVEYLGFDIAITEDGFSIIELNIHQDLHKYVEYPDSVKDFFREKIQQKRLKNEILND